jgi:hypothetical protein
MTEEEEEENMQAGKSTKNADNQHFLIKLTRAGVKNELQS